MTSKETESSVEIWDEVDSDLVPAQSGDRRISVNAARDGRNQQASLVYVVIPIFFLLVTLLGGLRFSSGDNAFVFLKPPLICLVFAAVLLVLFFRARLLDLDGWFSHDFSMLKNAANAAVLAAIFTACTQLFNSLLPEQGLPFWVVGFCFFWTLWNNLFSEFDTKRLLRSLGALFGFAFFAKYLILANLTAPVGDSWLKNLIENPAKQTFTWLLDLPHYSAATGYVQFFTLALFLIGLFLTPPNTKRSD